jgi:hypothetical protein
MAVLMFKVRTDARNIYLYGNYGFLAITNAEYIERIKKYAAETFTKEQIDNALLQGWITQQEYGETIAYLAVII